MQHIAFIDSNVPGSMEISVFSTLAAHVGLQSEGLSDCISFLPNVKVQLSDQVNCISQSLNLCFTDISEIRSVPPNTKDMALVIAIEKNSLSVQLAYDFGTPFSRL